MLRIYFAVLFRQEANTTVALFNPLGNIFLTIKIMPNEPLDGAVKSNFYRSRSLCKTISLLTNRELEVQAHLPTRTGNLKTFFRTYLYVHFPEGRFTLSCNFSGDGVWNVFWIWKLHQQV